MEEILLQMAKDDGECDLIMEHPGILMYLVNIMCDDFWQRSFQHPIASHAL
jgi:hypothetical protein